MNSAIDGSEDDGINLTALIRQLWHRKWTGVGFLVVFLCAGIYYLRNTDRTYTAELLVNPVDQNASKMPQGLSSLTSLVGVDLSSQPSSFAMYSDAIKSYSVAKRLSMDPHIMHSIYRGSWDSRSKQWRQPFSQFSSITIVIKDLIGSDRRPWHPPDASDLKLFIDKNVNLSEDKKKQGITIGFSNSDPKLAAYFVDKVNNAADTVLRERAVKRAEAYITYIKRRLADVEVYNYRVSLFDLLSSYEKTRMLASSDISYAGEAFSDVWVSPIPTNPKPMIVLAVSILAGLVSWAVYVLLVLPAVAAIRSSPAKENATLPAHQSLGGDGL